MDDQQPPVDTSATTSQEAEGDPPPMTIDEYADELNYIWSTVAEASAQLAADVTGIWRAALPMTMPAGLDMASSATLLAARMANLGPDGDPLETLTMGTIAFAQHAQAYALAEFADVERIRQELHDNDQAYE